MKGETKMKHIYTAQNNAMNFVIVRDMDTNEAIVIDYDVSDEQVDAYVNEFNKDFRYGFDDYDLHLTGDDDIDGWRDWDELISTMNGFEAL